MATDDVYLYDILSAAKKIVRITSQMAESEFAGNDVVQDSVIRQISIIGEAANELSDRFKDEHPEIQWHEIRGMRNRLVHDYKHVDINEVWITVCEDIPRLIRQIEPFLPSTDI